MYWEAKQVVAGNLRAASGLLSASTNVRKEVLRASGGPDSGKHRWQHRSEANHTAAFHTSGLLLLDRISMSFPKDELWRSEGHSHCGGEGQETFKAVRLIVKTTRVTSNHGELRAGSGSLSRCFRKAWERNTNRNAV